MTNFFPRLLLLLALPLVTLTARAQNVGIGTTAPDVSAALDIVSSDKGALLPRVAAAAAIASPATGLLVFQTGSPAGFYFNAGTPGSPSWQQLATAAGATITATNGLTKTGSAIALGGTLAGNTTLGLGGFNLGLTGGNVGIGTSSPAALLEVVGNVPTYVLTVDQQNTTGNSSTSNSGYWQSFTAGVSGPLDQVVTYDGTFDNVGGNPQVPCGALLAIYQGTGTGGAALATQSYTVPVYTNAPTAVTFGAPATLVAGQVYTYQVSLVSPPTPSTYLITPFCPTNCYAGGSNSLSGSWDAKFRTGRLTTSVIAASKLAVTPNGVGIGTATPTQALDVVGSSTVSGNATVGGSVGIGTGTPAQKLDVVGNSTVSGNATVGGSVGIGTGTPAQRLDVVGNATVSGNVGIGTSNPGQKLEVSGTVYSTSGGFKFPDGTTQASAAVAQINQTLSMSGQNLTISGAGGNTVALPASVSSASNGLSVTGGNVTLGGPLTANTDVQLNSKALTFSGSGSVGIGTTTPAASAALEVSSTTKGLLPPRMTQVQRDAIASPAAGLQVYNASTNRANVWNGSRGPGPRLPDVL